jgi:CRP-like cAMP-binding protein
MQLGTLDLGLTDAEGMRLARLAPMSIFDHCTRAELRAFAQAARPRRARAGAKIFRQGDPGTELFLLLDGEVDISRDGRHLVTLQPEAMFGEMAMLDEPERSASAAARSDTELLVISRAAFFSLLQDNPPLAVKILWNMNLRLSSNLRSTSRRLTEVESQQGCSRES